MSDYLSDIVNFLAENWLLIAIMIGVIFIIMKLLKSAKKSEYKPVVLSKEIKGLLKEMFDINQEKHGTGKTLFIGSRDSGYIMQSIEFPYHQKLKIALKDNLEYKKKLAQLQEEKANHDLDEFYDVKIAELQEDYKNQSTERVDKFFGFKTCGKGRIKRLLANFGIGLHFYIVNKKLITETHDSFYITYESRPEMFLGVWVFDNIAKDFLEFEAMKINREQELDSMENILGRIIYHDLDMSKEKAEMTAFKEWKKESRKSMIEDMKKS